MRKRTQKITDNWGACIAVLFIAVTLVYFLLMGKGIYMQPLDNLDSEVPWFKMIKDNGLFFDMGSKAPFLGGIDRNYLHSDLQVYTWLFMIFPPFIALLTGWYLKVILSVAGFVYLGRTVFEDKTDINICIACGLIHGILPTYPACALGFATLPFLMAFMIRMYRKWERKYILILFIYPIFSDLFMFGIFICGYMILFFIIDWIVSKKAKWRFVAGTAIMSVSYAIVDWRLFYTIFVLKDETIRDSYVLDYLSVSEALKETVFQFAREHYAIQTFVVLPVCLIYLIYVNYRYISDGNRKGIRRDPFNWVIVWQLFNCIVAVNDNMKWFRVIISTVLPPLKGFVFGRTMWFSPLLWYFAFMIVLHRVSIRKILKFALCALAFVAVCLNGEWYNEIPRNCILAAKRIVGDEKIKALTGTVPDIVTYDEFYSEDLFDAIKEDIGYDGEWSVAYGMHPGILSYNGIATLDGYLSYYPITYKEQFRKLIGPELAKDPDSAEYFDDWGGRAYIFSKDTVNRTYWSMDVDESEMLIDPDVFKDMGGKYVFSRVTVSNADDISLHLVGKYTDEKSPYVIYVYSN